MRHLAWLDHIGCKDVDPELFFGQHTSRAARAICESCPVRQQCADYGREIEYGIFGGLKPGQRRAGKKVA